jgi:uncharacterized protein YggE
MFRTTGAFGDAIVRLILSFAALAIFASTSAFAQPPNLAVEPLRYGLSPWWLGQPVIAVTGSVEMEVPANEASFEITFDAVQKTSQDAVREVAQKASALGRALQGSSNERVQVQSKIAITPLYEQYRDKDGNRIDNGQPDKIERYQAAAILSVEMQDANLAEGLFATALAADPTALSEVDFSYKESEILKSDLYKQAVADAQRRARLAVEVSGAKLGAVRMVDETGRACRADILIKGESSLILTQSPTAVRLPAPTDARSGPPASGAAALPLQPPRQIVKSQACVIYALN